MTALPIVFLFTLSSISVVAEERATLDSILLHNGIEAIVMEAIDASAFPGCQILIAHKGETIYYQSFGYHTYSRIIPVKNSDLYDLASITKTTATTLALMKLYEEGKFSLDATLGSYFPYLKNSNKADLTPREVLAHHGGLKNWIPYYHVIQKRNGKYKRQTITTDSSARFPNRIPGSQLFLHKDFTPRIIYRTISRSPLYSDAKYVYSGLSFYIFPDLIQRLSGISFEKYLYHNFYSSLGAKSLTFNPTRKFALQDIVPTEVDTFFRMNTLHGVVHDQGAAMMLGISGNAGLFGNAADLAKVYQMLLNNGSFDGRTYLLPETIERFTSYQYPELDNRRGLGFDKPLLKYDSLKSSVAQDASASSFGHTGYTGTLVWADPDAQLLFVFLSNRVHPTRANRQIYQLNVRPKIHQLIYDIVLE